MMTNNKRDNKIVFPQIANDPVIGQEIERLEFSPRVLSSVESIGPDLAYEYLKTQKLNRKPTPLRVKDYADRMLRGEWHLSQPLQFTSEGDLFDGQHRLLAVRMADVTCDFIVLRGLPPETRQYVDIGQNRKTNQIAEIMGVGTSLNSKLATCKSMFIGGSLKSKNKTAEVEGKGLIPVGNSVKVPFSPHKIIELYVKHQEAIDFADYLKTPATAPVRAVVARAWYTQNHIRLEQFMDVINSGFVITEKDDAAIALRNTLITMRAERKLSGSSYVISVYKKTVNALSHFLAGNNIRFIKEKDTELFPLADFD